MALTKDEVLSAALEILDTKGLPDLTMRRLADALGVRAGAIYWHYPNKQSILAAVGDAILGGETPGTARVVGEKASISWRAELGSWADALRTRLLAHRDAADVVLSMRAMGLLSVDPAHHGAQILTRAGLRQSDAASHARTLVHFVLGHAYQEQSRAQYAELGVAEGPAAADHEGFRAGIGLLLDGCAAAVAR